jgi:UDP-glucose 4-epimerase
MKVLVTGSSGRIGAAVCRALLDGGDEPLGLDARPGAFTKVHADLLELKALNQAMAGTDAVVHCAALHAPHVGVRPDADFQRINVDGTRAVLYAAQTAGVRRLVFTSTTALYGAAALATQAALWVTEDTSPAPQTVYHRSKLEGEALLQEAAAQGGPGISILRMSRCFPEAPAVMALHRLSRGLDARDVADAHVLALRHPRAVGSTFVISGATPFVPEDAPGLWHDAPAVLRQRAPGLVSAFAQRGWALPPRIDRVYDPGRALRELGWSAQFGWRNVLAETNQGTEVP